MGKEWKQHRLNCVKGYRLNLNNRIIFLRLNILFLLLLGYEVGEYMSYVQCTEYCVWISLEAFMLVLNHTDVSRRDV
jgi:hypothetical protein